MTESAVLPERTVISEIHFICLFQRQRRIQTGSMNILMTGTAAQTPVMDVTEIPAEPQVFQSGTLSTGLELVDTYLWIFKHFMEGKVLTRSLACLVYIKPYSDRTDSVTFQSVAKRSKVFLDKLQEPTSEMINKRGNIWCWKS